jgi:hypothetical protein
MKQKKMVQFLNFDNNAQTKPAPFEYAKEYLDVTRMFELRDQVKNSILSLTNILETAYDDYDIYFAISGSAAIDTIMKLFMENSEKTGKLVSTNTEHISTMLAAGQYNVDVVNVVDKKYNLNLTGTRLIHCIVANNETGIVYTSFQEYLRTLKAEFATFPMISGDTIQCLGKTNTVDYTLFDLFTFTSQKMFSEPGLSGFVYRRESLHWLRDPTIILSQYQCQSLINGIAYLKTVADVDSHFKQLEEYTFQKVVKELSSRGIPIVVVINSVN